MQNRCGRPPDPLGADALADSRHCASAVADGARLAVPACYNTGPRRGAIAVTINQDISAVLQALSTLSQTEFVSGPELGAQVEIPPERINDAMQLLEDSGYARVVRTMGNAPFDFSQAQITAAGRFELERAIADAEQKSVAEQPTVRSAPRPVGSPFGFTDLDWDFIDVERHSKKLIVVFGYQFESQYYDTKELIVWIERDFELALVSAQPSVTTDDLVLDFVLLRAGYGEHLFNQIARSIIAADIAVFDTSDQNPNVMIELGVALTWGTRVHPIREASTPPPPNDISGQTWARYTDNGSSWEDADHYEKLAALVALAARRKAARL